MATDEGSLGASAAKITFAAEQNFFRVCVYVEVRHPQACLLCMRPDGGMLRARHDRAEAHHVTVAAVQDFTDELNVVRVLRNLQRLPSMLQNPLPTTYFKADLLTALGISSGSHKHLRTSRWRSTCAASSACKPALSWASSTDRTQLVQGLAGVGSMLGR